MINKIQRAVNFLLYALVTVVLGALTLFVCYTVIMRYVFHAGFPAGEELCRYLFVYASVFGIILGVNANTHMKLDVLEEKFPQMRGLVKICYYACNYLFFGIVAVYGTSFAAQAATAKSTLLPITMNYVYGAIPMCGYFCLFIVTLQLIKDVTTARNKETEGGQA